MRSKTVWNFGQKLQEKIFTVFFILTGILVIGNSNLYAQEEHKNPNRGFQPGASYALSDIETINTTNGNLMLNIPLVKLPKGRGEVGQGISLMYNSKLYDTSVEELLDSGGQLKDQNMLVLSDDGGWKYALNTYALSVKGRFDTAPQIPCDGTAGQIGKNAYLWRVEMYMPDGSRKEFRPTGYGDYYDDGFFNMSPNGYLMHACPSGGNPTATLQTTSGMVYYSTDGSYIKLVIDYVSGGDVRGQNNPWTMYLPDGSRVTGGGGNATRMYDRNNNYIEGLTDNFGRSISIQLNAAQDEDHIIMQGVDNEELKWKVKWKTISVNKSYQTTAADSGRGKGGTSTQTLNMSGIRMVDKIILPTQFGSLQYEFNYNTESGGTGWGELSYVKLPSGAEATYGYAMPIPANTENGLLRYVSQKTLTYLQEYDGSSSSTSDVWTYQINKIQSTITAPNGSETTEHHGDTSYQHLKSGLVYKTVNSDGSISERIWAFNRPPGANSSANINAYVKTEFTTISDASGNPSLTAIKDYTIDPNGNQTEVKEYDWVAYSSVPKDSNGNATGIPSGATLKRTTTTSYYNSATSDSTKGYWAGTSPNVRNAVARTEIAGVSATEIVYDNASTTANPTEVRTWDSTKGTVSNPLTTGTNGNSIAITTQYDTYGNPTQTTDAKGNITQITYGSVGGYTGLYPTEVKTAYNTSIQQTVQTQYDFYTGLPTTVTALGNTTNENVVNETEYDDLGRPTKVKAAVGTAHEIWTTTEYNDTLRRVITRADVETKGDGKKIAIQHFDQLGRVRLTRQIENVATEDPYDETDGIKVQTRYLTDDPNSYQLTSNPYRASTATGATSEESMGWTRSKAVNTGKHSEVETFSGASLPAPWGSNSNSTGVVQTDIDENSTLVTDQAGKQRRSITNALGQIIRVDEPDSSGNLGTVSAPVQPTNYEYNMLGKMIEVTQGVQQRFFLYDSLGRLLRVRQPEQQVNTALNLSGSEPTNTQWTTGFTYDNNGNILTATDAKNVTITNTYDALNRPLTKAYSDSVTPQITFTYDDTNVLNSKGRLTKVSSTISETRYTSYDIMGRLLSSEQATDGQTYSSSYKYNLAGMLIEQTYPSGRVVKEFLTTEGKLTGISSKVWNGQSKMYASNINYTATGVIKYLQIGNGLWESAKLNSRQQVTELNLGTSSTNGSKWQLKYDYGEFDTNGNVDLTKNSGNIAKQTISMTGLVQPFVQTYKYDSLDRISEAKETNNGNQTWIQNFGYDRYGNRTSFSQDMLGQQLQINNLTMPTVDPNTNRFQTGQGYSYDADGNLTQDAMGNQFTFDGENKQTEVKDSQNNIIGQYYYDGNGKRVKKVTNAEIVIFVYDGMGKLAAEYSTLTPPTNPTTNYTATDPLGSPRVITNKLGEIVSRRDFMPFGEQLAPDTTYRTANLKYNNADNVKQKFTGYQRDDETGLDFAEARYYNNSHGRFTAVDPLLASGKSANPQTFNRYVYTMNRPLILTDPTGLQSGRKVDQNNDSDVIKVNTDINKNAPMIINKKMKIDGKTYSAPTVEYLDKDSYRTAVPIGGKFRITYSYLINKPPEGTKPEDYGTIESVDYKSTVKDGKLVDEYTEKPSSGGTFATAESVEKLGQDVTITGTANEAVIVTKSETFKVLPRKNMGPGTGSIGFQLVVRDPVTEPRKPDDPVPTDGSKPKPNPATWTTRENDDKRISIRKEGVRRQE